MSGAKWRGSGKGSKIHPLFAALQGESVYVRTSQLAQVRTRDFAAAYLLVLRRAHFRAGKKTPVRRWPGVCRTHADGAERGGLLHAGMGGPRQDAGAQR